MYKGVCYSDNRSKTIFCFKDDGSHKLKNQPYLSGMDLWNKLKLGLKSDFFKK